MALSRQRSTDCRLAAAFSGKLFHAQQRGLLFGLRNQTAAAVSSEAEWHRAYQFTLGLLDTERRLRARTDQNALVLRHGIDDRAHELALGAVGGVETVRSVVRCPLRLRPRFLQMCLEGALQSLQRNAERRRHTERGLAGVNALGC